MRYKDMDVARAVFMMLGVVYHASLVYRPSISWSFIIVSEESHFFFNILSSLLHDFRMHGFYLIAGFFTALSLNKKSRLTFLKDRLIRLGTPLLFVGLTLNVVIQALLHGDEALDFTKLIISGDWLIHLWFLGNLLVYILICYILKLDKWFGKIEIKYKNSISVNVIIVTTISLITVVFDYIGSLIDKDLFFFISIERLFIYFPIFLSGILFYYNYKLYNDITEVKNSAKTLIPFILLFILSKYLGLEVENKQVYMFFDFSYNVELSFLMLGLLSYISKSFTIHSSLINSSYSVYLLHMPFMVAFFLLIEPMNLNVFVAFTLLSTLTFIVCYLFHILIINKSRILLFLFNGQITAKFNVESQQTT